MRWILLTLLATVTLTACGGDSTTTPEASVTETGTAAATEPAPATATAIRPTIGPRASLESGAIGRADAFRVELLQVTDPWTPASPVPGEGERYVLIAVTIENRSDLAYNISFLNFTFVAGGEQFSGESVSGADPYLTPQTVAPGAVIQGFVAAAIPAEQRLVSVEFDADTSTDAHISFIAR